MTAPIELIVAMMPHAIQITQGRDGEVKIGHLTVKDIESGALFTVQVAARMAEEALRLSQPPAEYENHIEAQTEIKRLLKDRLSTPMQREGLLRGLDAKIQGELVGITHDGLFREPDPEDAGLTIVRGTDVISVIEESSNGAHG